jgi:predicted DNA-binding protein
MRKLEGPEADYIKTSLRLPPELKEEVKQAADTGGHSMNAELVARIAAKPIHEKLDALEREVAQIKAIVIELRDR